jgi:hypothetical protein
MVCCHLFADTEEELHAMAAQIGLDRRWHQQGALAYRRAPAAPLPQADDAAS